MSKLTKEERAELQNTIALDYQQLDYVAAIVGSVVAWLHCQTKAAGSATIREDLRQPRERLISELRIYARGLAESKQ